MRPMSPTNPVETSSSTGAVDGVDQVEISDLDLVESVRRGDNSAFGVLWSRHADAGMRAARRITSRFDPEDGASP